MTTRGRPTKKNKKEHVYCFRLSKEELKAFQELGSTIWIRNLIRLHISDQRAYTNEQEYPPDP